MISLELELYAARELPALAPVDPRVMPQPSPWHSCIVDRMASCPQGFCVVMLGTMPAIVFDEDQNWRGERLRLAAIQCGCPWPRYSRLVHVPAVPFGRHGDALNVDAAGLVALCILLAARTPDRVCELYSVVAMFVPDSAHDAQDALAERIAHELTRLAIEFRRSRRAAE